MRRKYRVTIIPMLAILALSFSGALHSQEEGVSKDKSTARISYEKVERNCDDGICNIMFTLKITNTDLDPIHDVIVRLQTEVQSSQPEEHAIETIGSEESVDCAERHELTFDAADEPPELVWLVKYMDDGGNIVEEVVK